MFGHRGIHFIIPLVLLVIVFSECRSKKNEEDETGMGIGDGKIEDKVDENSDIRDKEKGISEDNYNDKNKNDQKHRRERSARKKKGRGDRSDRRRRRERRRRPTTRTPRRTPTISPAKSTPRTSTIAITRPTETTTNKRTMATTSKPAKETTNVITIAKSRPTSTQTDKSLKKLEKYESSIDVANKTQVYDVLSIFTDILSKDTTTDKEKDTGADKIEKDIMALRLMENIGQKMAAQLKPTEGKPATAAIVAGEQVFGVAAITGSELSGFSFPEQIKDLKNSSSLGARVDLPNSVLAATKSNDVNLVFMIYNPSTVMKAKTGDHPTDVEIGGKVVMASIFPPSTFSLTEPAVITIQNTETYPNTTVEPTCAFLVENSSGNGSERFGIWSTRGCHLAYSNETHSICHCYHLTNFAILLQFGKNKLTQEQELALNTITYVGLSLSIIGCFLTLIVHLVLPKLWNERGFIHMNLVASLGIANIVFLFETVPVKNSTSCTVLAIILFYFYLAAFFWMLLEGIHIYRKLVKVFESGKDPRKIFFLAGWGIPLVIVLTSALAFRDNITSEFYCWLSATNGALWTFAVPLCLVIFINAVMLIIVLRKSLNHSQDKNLKRSMLKTFCILVPLLGITWIFGIVTFNKNILALQYIFAILNTLQGFMIFLFYCLYNAEVKREILQKISLWRTEHEIERAQNSGISNLKSFEKQIDSVSKYSPAVQKTRT